MINEKKSEQAPPQTIIYLGVQIDLRNMTLALPQDHVDSPLTMRGGDTFVSSDSAPARVHCFNTHTCREGEQNGQPARTEIHLRYLLYFIIVSVSVYCAQNILPMLWSYDQAYSL